MPQEGAAPINEPALPQGAAPINEPAIIQLNIERISHNGYIEEVIVIIPKEPVVLLQQAIFNNNEGQIAHQMQIVISNMQQNGVPFAEILPLILFVMPVIKPVHIPFLADQLQIRLPVAYTFARLEQLLKARCFAISNFRMFMCKDTCNFRSGCLCGNPPSNNPFYDNCLLEQFCKVYDSWPDGPYDHDHSHVSSAFDDNFRNDFELFRELYPNDPQLLQSLCIMAGDIACEFNVLSMYNYLVQERQLDPFMKSLGGPSGLYSALASDYTEMISTVLTTMITYARAKNIPDEDILGHILGNISNLSHRLPMRDIPGRSRTIYDKLCEHNVPCDETYLHNRLDAYFIEN